MMLKKVKMKFILQIFNLCSIIAKHPLNQDFKIRAIFKFLRWQIASRVVKYKFIVNWVNGASFIVSKGETGLTGNIYTGFSECEDMIFLCHSLQSSEKFVDVGANAGAYSILASKVCNASVIAFEPLLEAFNRLKDQIHYNKTESTVDCRNQGIGDKICSLPFTNNRDTVNKVSLSLDGQNTTIIQVSTLDIELDNYSQYFLKIDVEGFEFNVIEGAHRLLSSNQVTKIIIELNSSGIEYGHTNQDVHEKIMSYNFIPISYDYVNRKISRLESYNKSGGNNTIYVKYFDQTAKQVRESAAIIVHTAFGMSI